MPGLRPDAPSPPIDPLTRPIFIVAPPRAGTRLVARSLNGPGCWTLGSGANALLGSVPELDAADGSDEGRLDRTDCTPDVRQKVRGNLQVRFAASQLRRSPARAAARLLDSSPRNALRVPFLDAAFPDATFVYVHREPTEALAEALLVWRNGTAVTYPKLPGWTGPPWSFLLVPGWRDLVDRPLAEVVTEQWVRAMSFLTDDLERLGPDRWCVVEYDALQRDRAKTVGRLATYLELGRTAPVHSIKSTPFTAAGLSAARAELEPYLDRTTALAQRAAEWLAAPA